MTLSLDLLPEIAAVFVLIFARLGAMIMLLPGFGEQYLPPRMRLTVALMLTLIMFPLLRPVFGVMPETLMGALVLLAHELAIGLFIGLTIRVVAATLVTAGTVIANQTSLASVLQTNLMVSGEQSLVLSNFLSLLGIAVVFALDLHHVAIGAIYDSYRMFRPGVDFPLADFAQAALSIFVASFVLAMQIAAPFLVSGLVFQVALGVLSRMMPQLQIMFLATPAQLIAGFLLLAALLGTALGWYATHVEDALLRFSAH